MEVRIFSAVALGVLALTCTAMVFAHDANEDEASTVRGTPPTNAHSIRGGGKALVAYFTVPETDGVDASSGASRLIDKGKVVGNTEFAASVIAEAVGGDLFEIKTVRSYPGTHKALIDAAKEEADSDARPALATHIKNLADYDVVFVGFPNWWYDMPMPLYSFFEEYDFGGKTIVPFCTHGGSRFSDAISTIRKLEKGATVRDGYAISRNKVADSRERIASWLESIGMK